MLLVKGNEDQHWHRDTDLLFPNDELFADRDVHDSLHGIHEPPYAINMFVPLVRRLSVFCSPLTLARRLT